MRCWIAALTFALTARGVALAQAPPLQWQAGSIDFGRVLKADGAERSIGLANPGPLPVRIDAVALTPPLRVLRMPREIGPGERAEIVVGLPSLPPRGRYEGALALRLAGREGPPPLPVFAEVIDAIGFSPRPMFFVAGARGSPASASIEIVNHEAEPLRLGPPQHSGRRFSTTLETIEDGRRFRLTLHLPGDAAAGADAETIAIDTSSAAMPRIGIAANTLMRERVYSFPQAVDLGAIPIGVVRQPGAAERLAQTLMVYQVGGSDFRILRVDSDVPGLRVRTAAGPQGDRHQLTLSLDPDALRVGPLRGVLRVHSNDPAWPQLEVPVSGAILPDL